MDEILASIRRIIAEEPTGSRPPPAAAPAAPGPALPSPQSPVANAPAATPAKSDEPKSPTRGRLSDALQAASPDAPKPAAGRSQPDDDPLAGLVEPETGSPAADPDPEQSAAHAAPAEEVRGPLWFLKRKAEAGETPPVGPPVSPAPAAEGRGALPPLFGGPGEPTLPRGGDRVKPLDLEALKTAMPEPRPEAPSAAARPEPAPVAEREAPVAVPPVAATVEPAAPMPAAAPAAATPFATTTLEDTVAELLRPMLRQWLDANMPRILEKALKGELAQRQSGSKT